MSWVPVSASSHFPIQNLPFGIFSTVQTPWRRAGVAIGDHVLDLFCLSNHGLLDGLGYSPHIFGESTLNSFMELERPAWRATRTRLQDLLSDKNVDTRLSSNETLKALALIPLSEAIMHMPAKIGDYTDFYSSREHATNVGIMFRGVDNALQPNWLHLPVGYHGRSSSVVVSGTDVVRPQGQVQADAADPKKGSNFSPCRLLDFELEMGVFLGGKGNELGRPLTIEEAEDKIFGLVLLNDWSARDIQAWEYVPLGPFTAKNFCTSISPWIVTLEALEDFRTETSAGPVQADPVPLPYLQDKDYARSTYDIRLEVALKGPKDPEASVISVSNLRYMYWNMRQQLVHHSVTGCPMTPGDLLGSGTISGPTQDSFGSMLELSWRGSREVVLNKSTEEPPIRNTCSWRVRLALELKGFSYEYAAVDLLPLVGNTTKTLPEQFKNEVNPLEQVPVLEITNLVDGTVDRFAQSVAIIEYLEEAFPGTTKLFPDSLKQRALARQLAEIVNSGIQPLQALSILRQVKSVELIAGADGESRSGVARDFAIDAVHRGFVAIEALLPPANSGLFAAGTHVPTVADIFLIPQVYNAGRFGIDLVPYPKIQAIVDKCKDLEAFKRATPEAQPDAVL
eukprot:gene370-245_t